MDQIKDAEWECVGLPHTFSLPYFRSESFYEGYGWYRKNLQIEENWLNKSINLEFDGIFQVAEVYLNGTKVGENRGGYTDFEIDITNAVKAGEEHLAVRVNNLWYAQLAPRAGEKLFLAVEFTGILFVCNRSFACHVAWNGTFVTTTFVSK